MKKVKRTHQVHAAWDYELEEKNYDEMSRQGWEYLNSTFNGWHLSAGTSAVMLCDGHFEWIC